MTLRGSHAIATAQGGSLHSGIDTTASRMKCWEDVASRPRRDACGLGPRFGCCEGQRATQTYNQQMKRLTSCSKALLVQATTLLSNKTENAANTGRKNLVSMASAASSRRPVHAEGWAQPVRFAAVRFALNVCRQSVDREFKTL